MTSPLITKFVADFTDFSKPLLDAVKQTKMFGSAGEEAGKKTEKGLNGAAKSAVFAAASFAAASVSVAGIAKAFKFAEEGAKAVAVGEFFDRSGKSITKYREAVNGMVSDSELMQKANLADSMGINQQTFMSLAKVAQASALKTGQSFDHMFESIIVGTARSSRMLLDNLGIIVSVDTANKKYAKSALQAAGAKDISTAAVNKYIKAMTEEEKKIAFANEVQAQSGKITQEMLDLTDKSAAGYAKVTAALENTMLELKKSANYALAEWLPTFQNAFSLLSIAIKDFGSESDGIFATAFKFWSSSAQSFFQYFADGIGISVDHVKTLVKVISTAAGAFYGLVSAGPLGAILGGAAGLAGSTVVTDKLAKAPDKGVDKAVPLTKSEEMGQALKMLKAEASRQGLEYKKILAMSTKTIEGLPTASQELVTGIRTLAEKLGEWVRPPEHGKVEEKGGAKGGKAAKTLDSQLSEINKQVDDYKKILESQNTAEDAIKGKLGEKRLALITSFGLMDDVLKKFPGVIADAQADIRDSFAAMKKAAGWDSGQSPMMSNGSSAVTSQQQAANAEKHAQAVYDKQKASDKAAAVPNALTGVVEGIGSFITGGLSGVMSMIGPALSAAMGPWGVLLEVIITLLAPAVEALTGFKDIMDIIGQLISALVSGLDPLLRMVATVLGALMPVFAAVGDLIGKLLAPFLPILQVVATLLNGLSPIISVLLQILVPILTALNAPLMLLVAFIGILMDVLTPVLKVFASALKWFANILAGFFNGFLNAFANLLSFIPLVGKSAAKAVRGMMIKPETTQSAEIGHYTDSNTKAVKENTEAVKDLSREFRNLPSGYKVEGAIFAAQRAVPKSTQDGSSARDKFLDSLPRNSGNWRG